MAMAMALQNANFLFNSKSKIASSSSSFSCVRIDVGVRARVVSSSSSSSSSSSLLVVTALDRNGSGRYNKKRKAEAAPSAAVPYSNYVVPLDNSSCMITRPLAEILRDLNKRVPVNIIKPDTNHIPWYHANRMLSFYAPGWCGEIRDVIFSDNGSVTVVCRVTIHGSDGEAHRESTGTVSLSDGCIEDPVAAAEQIAFCRACARFGLGLYLYHEDDSS